MKGSTFLALISMVGVLFLPFLGQAFHIDDRIYLEIADNIPTNVFYPYDYAPVFEGLVTADAASHSHLPLTSYYLALIRTVTQSSQEWVYHSAFLVFPVLAIFAFYDLAGFFVERRLAAAALLAASPAFLVLGHTLMPDVPLLALWLVTLSRFFRISNGSYKLIDQIVLIFGLLGTSMISLVSMGLVCLMGAYLILQPQRESGPSRIFWVGVFAAPLCLWLAWYLRAYWHYDRFVLVNTFLHMSKRETLDWALVGTKGLSFILNIGGAFLFPGVIWYAVTGAWRTRIALLAFFLCMVPFYLWVPGWESVHVLIFALFLASGLLVFVEFADVSRASPEKILLSLWFFGILACCLALFYAGSVRYALLALPPVVLVCIARLERSVPEPYFQRNLVWLGVLLTAVFSLPVAYADYFFAGAYRSFARELYSDYQVEDRTVWFTAEWGLRYYLEREGASLMRRTEVSAEPGDIIIKPFLASPWVTPYDGDSRSRLLEQRLVDTGFPVRILDFYSHAGFYSTGWGILPFSVSTGREWEWFNVFRVQKRYEGPPPEEERHY